MHCPVRSIECNAFNTSHITADGKYCITGSSDRTVRLWNPTRIDPAYRPPPTAAAATFADGINDAQVSSSRIISSQEYYGRPQQPSQPLPSALPMQTYADGHVHPISSIATNSSSTILLSASDKTLLATDLVTAQLKQKFWGHVGRIEYVTCLGAANNDNGHMVGDDIYASASYDSTVRLWDARSRAKEPLMVLDQATDAVTCVAAGKGGDAQIVTSSVDGKVRHRGLFLLFAMLIRLWNVLTRDFAQSNTRLEPTIYAPPNSSRKISSILSHPSPSPRTERPSRPPV